MIWIKNSTTGELRQIDLGSLGNFPGWLQITATQARTDANTGPLSVRCPDGSGAISVYRNMVTWLPKPAGGLDQDETGAYIITPAVQVANLVSLTAAAAPAAVSAAVNVETFAAAKTTRAKLDLTGYTQVRLSAMTIATGNAATSAVKLSYMAVEAATWAGTDAGATVVLGTNGGVAGVVHDSGWQTLAVPARASVTVAALVGVAFSTTAPTVGNLTAYFR